MITFCHSVHPKHLQDHCKQDKTQPIVKAGTQVFIFMENNKRKYNTIYRFKVIGKVGSEG